MPEGFLCGSGQIVSNFTLLQLGGFSAQRWHVVLCRLSSAAVRFEFGEFAFGGCRVLCGGNPGFDASVPALEYGSFRKLGVPYFGVLIRILSFRVLY